MDFYSGARELVEEEVTGSYACSGTNLTASLVMVDMLYRCKVYNQLFKKISVFTLNKRRKGKFLLCSSCDIISWKTCEGAY